MRLCLSVFAMIALLWAGPAAAQAYSGTAGVDSTGAVAPVPNQAMPPVITPAQPVTNTPTLPPVFQGADGQVANPAMPPAMPTQPVAPVQPTVPQAAQAPASGGLDANALPPDPCAAYLNSYDAYAVCQDRMQRLQRMKEAQTKRVDAKEAARARAEERRAAREAPAASEDERRNGIRRPGQVPATPRQPMPVQVVPAPETTTPATK